MKILFTLMSKESVSCKKYISYIMNDIIKIKKQTL